MTGIDKSAAHRIAVTLHAAGWLRPTPEGAWVLSPTVSQRLHAGGERALVAAARPRLEALRDHTGETAMLVRVEHGRLLVLDAVDSHHVLRITAPPGAELPIAHSSAAQAIAAHLPLDELGALRRYVPGLDERTLSAVRRRGWAMNDRAIVLDARAVGAAVLSDAGLPVAAIIVCAPTSRVTLAQMRTIGARVAESAATVRVWRDPQSWRPSLSS